MPNKTKIKICGITNINDALSALELGADYLGFNFYPPSPRYITPDNAAKIIAQLPADTQNIGVFVNEKLDNIAEIVTHCPLTAAQLHGDESVTYVSEIKSADIGTIKVFRIDVGFDWKQVQAYADHSDNGVCASDAANR